MSSRQVFLRGAAERWARDRAALSRAASACEERQRGLVEVGVDGPLVTEVRVATPPLYPHPRHYRILLE